MGVRGQNPEAWVARFRQGTCPIHGTGFVVITKDGKVDVDEDGRENVRCINTEPGPCTVLARRWSGKDAFHHRFAWVAGPEDIRLALRKGNDIDDEGKPTRWSREARTSYPVEDLG